MYTITPINPSPGDTISINESVVFTIDGDSSLDIIVTSNGETVTFTSEEVDGLLEVTLNLDLLYDAYYLIVVTVEDDTRTWSFYTESAKVSEIEIPYLYSEKTQELSNYYPELSAIRNDRYSVGQQFLNPVAERLEDTDTYVNSLVFNLFPRTNDISQISSVTESKFYGFEFLSNYLPDGQVEFTLPTIYGYQDGARLEQTIPDENTIWAADVLLPDQFKATLLPDAEDRDSYMELSAYQDLENYETGYNNQSEFLFVEDAEQLFYRDINDNIKYPIYRITGKTDRDIVEASSVQILYNGLYQLDKKFRTLKALGLENHENIGDASLKRGIAPSCFGEDLVIPGYSTIRTTLDNRRIWWQLEQRESEERGTLLRQLIYIAKKQSDYIDGLIDLTSYREFELQYNSLPLEIDRIWEHPNKKLLYGIGRQKGDYSSTYLYIFPVQEEYPSKEVLSLLTNGIDPNYIIKVEVLSETLSLDNSSERVLEIRPISLSDLPKIARTRICVYTPDLTQHYLNKQGVECSANQSWVQNMLAEGYFDSYTYDYTMTEPGDYVWIVETQYTDGNYHKASTLVRNLTKNALACYKTNFLPTDPIDIWFDNDGVLKLMDYNYHLYSIEEIRNRAIIDFAGFTCYSLNPYLTDLELTYED